MTTLTDLKAIAARRMPGPWFTDGAFTVENSHAIIADCKQQLADVFDDNQVVATAEFIAMCANNIDKLIAVCEAAKEYLNPPQELISALYRQPENYYLKKDLMKYEDICIAKIAVALAALEADK